MKNSGDLFVLAVLLYVAVDAHRYFKRRGEAWFRRAWLGLAILTAITIGSLLAGATIGGT